MMYLYMDFSDGTDMTCSHLICKDGQEYVEIHFERPVPHGLDSARCRIPEYTWLFNDGFSEEEITTFTELIKLVEKDLFELGREAAQGLINEEGNHVYHVKPI